MLNKKLILRIGYPKTASTTLQVNFLGRLIELKKILFLANVSDLKDYTYKNKLGIHNCYKYILTSRKNNNRITEELKKIDKINQKVSLLSAVSIAWIAQNTAADHLKLSLLINKNSERIHELLNKYFNKIVIVIVIRNQNDLCLSIYKETLKVYSLLNYKDWIKKILTNNAAKNSFINFNKQINNYQKLFDLITFKKYSNEIKEILKNMLNIRFRMYVF